VTVRGSNPRAPTISSVDCVDLGSGTNTGINTSDLLDRFERFLRIDLNLASRTIRKHLWEIGRLLKWLGSRQESVSVDDLRSYLVLFQDKSPATKANVLKSLRVFFNHFLHRPDLVESFHFPKESFTPRQLPNKGNLRRFFDALDNDRDRAFFLLAASSGLRRSELLSLRPDGLNLGNRTVIPKNAHQNASTKNSWISLFNNEAETYLRRYLEKRKNDSNELWQVGETAFRKAFKKASQRSGVKLTPQVLRFWFANELGRLGVADRFIDALQGRTPRSILARHYSDFSPERLREVYDKANLTVLA